MKKLAIFFKYVFFRFPPRSYFSSLSIEQSVWWFATHKFDFHENSFSRYRDVNTVQKDWAVENINICYISDVRLLKILNLLNVYIQESKFLFYVLMDESNNDKTFSFHYSIHSMLLTSLGMLLPAKSILIFWIFWMSSRSGFPSLMVNKPSGAGL